MFNILSIGGGKEQFDGILIAKELGYYVITINANHNCIGAKISHEFYCIDIKETDKIIQLAHSKQIIGIIPNPIGRYLTTVGSVNEALGLTGISFYAADIATDKLKFHQFAIKNNIPVAEQVEFIDINS
jgi:carbamoylphosphate synthase large subunit